MPDYTNLKGVQNVNRPLLNHTLESNIISFFRWGLLNIGGFSNVQVPTGGSQGGDFSKLRLSEDPDFIPGQVWEGVRSDWVYEHNIENNTQPIQISGVWVNQTFYPVSTPPGNFSHHFDYPRGRVVFDTPIDANSIVQCSYSYRMYHFTDADVPWYRQLMFNSFNPADPQFNQTGSGQWAIPTDMRLQMPAIVVEAVPRRTIFPRQLGGGTYTHQDILFNIFAESNWDRKQLLDMITFQWEKTNNAYDLNAVDNLDKFPLDFNGMVVPSAVMYPDLVDPKGNTYFRKYTFRDIQVQDQQEILPLFMGTVRATIELETPDIG